MAHRFFFIATLISCFSLIAWADESTQDDTTPLVQDVIKIEQDRLIYKGKSVPIPFTRKKLVAVFGEPNREIYNTAGTVAIWDEIGLTCFGCAKKAEVPEEFQYMTEAERKKNKPLEYVNAITLFVRKYNPYPDQELKYQHEPRLPFPGTIELDGVEFDGTVNFDDFIEHRQGRQTVLLPENSFSFYIRCKPEPHEITLYTVRDKYDDGFMSVYSVGIRNIGHYYRHFNCLEVFEPQAQTVDEETYDEPAPNPSLMD